MTTDALVSASPSQKRRKTDAVPLLMVPIARPHFGEEEALATAETVRSGWVGQGPKVAELERAFAAYVGAPHAVAVSNCTAALHLAMVVSGIGPGDEVICPSLSYIATANSVRHAGATPVFADVDEKTCTIDPVHAASLITPRTKALLIVHQFGMPADIDACKALCEQHGLLLIEDAACAVGSSYKGKNIGAHSDLVCFSFHPRKVMTTGGEGGMIVTSRSDIADRLRLLRQHGMSVNDRERHLSRNLMLEEYLLVGYNYKLSDVHASVGLVQLKKLEWMIAERRRIAALYQRAFSALPALQVFVEPPDRTTNVQSYVVRLRPSCALSRNDFMVSLLDAGIATRRVMVAHQEPVYAGSNVGLRLPVSESLADRAVLLPIFAGMTEDEVQRVIEAVERILAA